MWILFPLNICQFNNIFVISVSIQIESLFASSGASSISAAGSSSSVMPVENNGNGDTANPAEEETHDSQQTMTEAEILAKKAEVLASNELLDELLKEARLGGESGEAD
jgi:hypothetical protein